jgi:hypothetical protein
MQQFSELSGSVVVLDRMLFYPSLQSRALGKASAGLALIENFNYNCQTRKQVSLEVEQEQAGNNKDSERGVRLSPALCFMFRVFFWYKAETWHKVFCLAFEEFWLLFHPTLTSLRNKSILLLAVLCLLLILLGQRSLYILRPI